MGQMAGCEATAFQHTEVMLLTLETTVAHGVITLQHRAPTACTSAHSLTQRRAQGGALGVGMYSDSVLKGGVHQCHPSTLAPHT